ncbi:DNA primase [Enterococcus sp. MMGLQ5-2]|nr:DNA primase [Enterococcus sp. MMGLQ5-2]MBS7584243.1 DNA primase [Enterococcus sp. MMGLQ5-1]NPD12099.1 DNA primase [Enterococcus sp. MMGLQ5-1]NPD36671.1 DNA primase [Enterococcus sp. MMGLQ5-2]
MDELKEKLVMLGEQWRQEHTKINKNGEEKIPNVSPRAVANILKKQCNFILIDEDNPELAPLAVYDIDSGIYQKGERFINRLVLSVEYTLTNQQCNTVRHYLTVESEEYSRTTDKNLIVVNNGVYNRKTKRLEPFSSHYVFVNKVATDYVEHAKEPIFKDWCFSDWIKELSDDNASKEKLLWQLFAVAINANYISEITVFFNSEKGRTGKSTFQALMKNLVGKDNTSSLKIKEFESDFKLASAYGKTLLIGDDNNPRDFNETSESFKSVLTGDGVLLNPKGKTPFTTVLTPFVIQSMNGLPRFRDMTDGLLRRLRVIRFNHVYQGNQNNRNIKEKYIYDKRLLEFILYQALQLDFKEVEDTSESREAIYDLVMDNNPVFAFYEEVFSSLESTRLPVRFLFNYFQAYCFYDNQPTKMKQNTFTRELKPLVEKEGWEYTRNNLAPLRYFVEGDDEALYDLDVRYKFYSKVDREKYQPLFKRQTDNEPT